MTYRPNDAGSRHSARILFADDFEDELDAEARPPAGPSGKARDHVQTEEPVFTAADIETARVGGFAEGTLAARAEPSTSLHNEASQACRHLSELLDQARGDAALSVERASEAAAQLMFDALAVVLPSLSARHELNETKAIVHALIDGMTPDSSLCIRVPATIADLLRTAFAGGSPALCRRVAIEACPEMQAGDVTLTWRDGSATRSARKAQQAVIEILERMNLLTAAQPFAVVATGWKSPPDGASTLPAPARETRENANA